MYERPLQAQSDTKARPESILLPSSKFSTLKIQLHSGFESLKKQ